jgi:hypothetical protein
MFGVDNTFLPGNFYHLNNLVGTKSGAYPALVTNNGHFAFVILLRGIGNAGFNALMAINCLEPGAAAGIHAAVTAYTLFAGHYSRATTLRSFAIFFFLYSKFRSCFLVWGRV